MEAARHRHQGRARHWSRRLAIQAVYQWQMTAQPAAEIARQFGEDPNLSKADPDYFDELLRGVVSRREQLDRQLGPYLDRPIGQIDPVERAILRCAMHELMHRLDVPYRVVLNEAIELAKQFGSTQGHKFVNAVLDKALKDLRAPDTGGSA